MKHLKIQPYICFFILLFVSGCTAKKASPEMLAPSDIKGYVISFHDTKVGSSDSPNLDDTFLLNEYEEITFKYNDTYEDRVNGKLMITGSFSYKRKSYNQGVLINSYSNLNGEQSYTTIFTFIDKDSGTWKGSFGARKNSKEGGTFKIIKRN
jgi:hypothetical protein